MKSFKIPSLLITLLATTFGCSSLTAEVKPEVKINDANQVAVVNAEPRFNLCLNNNKCSRLGAKWDKENPDVVTLVVEYSSGVSIEEANLVVDGKALPLISGQVETSYRPLLPYSEHTPKNTLTSINSYDVSMEMFKKVLSAKELSISLELSDADKRHRKYYVDRISTDNKKGGGYKALESLMTAIEKA